MDKKTLKKHIIELCSIMSVSGFEKRASDKIKAMVENKFDEFCTDAVGNCIAVKRCGKENAAKVMIDAHLDEIGLIVTDIVDGGFLRVTSLGGIDVSIMQAADVIIYGEKEIRGVVASTPPHLKKDDKLPDFSSLLIDTGMSKTKLEEIVTVGTPVGFAPEYSELLEDKIMGKSFDDKACAACAIAAVASTPKEDLAADVYVMLSAVEETNRLGGVAAGTFSVMPDYAMVVDVNLARVPGTKDFETVEMDKGISVSFSAATDRALTLATIDLCREKQITFSTVAAPSSTGTNAATVNLVGSGTPVVDIGLPLASMHTYNEVISLNDAMTLYQLIKEFICSDDLAKQFKAEKGELI